MGDIVVTLAGGACARLGAMASTHTPLLALLLLACSPGALERWGGEADAGGVADARDAGRPGSPSVDAGPEPPDRVEPDAGEVPSRDAGPTDAGALVDAGPPAPVDWPAFGGVAPRSAPVLPAMARPDYRRWTTDPRTMSFGDGRTPTEVARVTDAATFGFAGSSLMRHQYAKVSPWNADGSLAMFFVQADRRVMVLVDGRDYEFVRVIDGAYNGGRWSMVEPTRYVQATSAPVMEAIDVLTSERVTLRDFRGDGYVEQASTNLFGGEGNPSRDDRVWAFQLRHRDRGWEIVVYDRFADRILGRIALPEPAGPGFAVLDYWAISPRGSYVVFYARRSWRTGGRSIPAGMNVFTVGGRYERTSSATGHVDLCLDASGREVIAFIGSKYESNDKVVQTFALDGSDGGTTTDQLADGFVGWNYHVSCQSTERPGHLVVSTFPDDEPHKYDGFPFWNHAFVVRLDGSGAPAVVANVHHANGSIRSTYHRSSFAVANRDLSAVWFSADWDSGSGDVHSYVARPRR